MGLKGESEGLVGWGSFCFVMRGKKKRMVVGAVGYGKGGPASPQRARCANSAMVLEVESRGLKSNAFFKVRAFTDPAIARSLVARMKTSSG
jgi:hypothetical protein